MTHANVVHERRSGGPFYGSAWRVKTPLRRSAVLTRLARSRELAITGATRRADHRLPPCSPSRERLPYTGIVKISLELPDALVQQLADNGQDLSRAALRGSCDRCIPDEPNHGSPAPGSLELPSRYELDGFLKHHRVPLDSTIEDFDREADSRAPGSGRSDKKNSQRNRIKRNPDCRVEWPYCQARALRRDQYSVVASLISGQPVGSCAMATAVRLLSS